MLYDPYGRPIPEARPGRPAAGVTALWERNDRDPADVSRDLTPAKVDAIMRLADSGDTADMCLLAERIDDKNFDIGAALGTRRAAIAATSWSIAPADDSAAAKRVAERVETILRTPHPDNDLLSFDQLVEFDLGSALLPGFACPEIVWGKGGELLGFSTIEQRHFTFRDSRTPRLVTLDAPSGHELPPGKFLLHWHRAKSGDAVRGGLIRSCAWLHCFANLNLKDLLRFVERYGMPFTVAKVGRESWEKDRNALKSLIKNFGPDGGGVFSEGVEIELLQAASSDGNVYFRLLEFLRDAAQRIILGQTLTSSSGGQSNNGAQHMVRMDIRGSDCRQIAATVNARLIPHVVLHEVGPAAPMPRMEYDIQESKDAQAEATVVETLERAGWRADADQVAANTGYRVTRRPEAEMYPPAMALAADPQPRRSPLAAPAQARRDALPMADDADSATKAPEAIAEAALPAARRALAPMFGPLQARLDALAGIADDAAFARELAALSDDLPAMLPEMDSQAFETALADAMRGSIVAGMAQRAAELKKKEGRR